MERWNIVKSETHSGIHSIRPVNWNGSTSNSAQWIQFKFIYSGIWRVLTVSIEKRQFSWNLAYSRICCLQITGPLSYAVVSGQVHSTLLGFILDFQIFWISNFRTKTWQMSEYHVFDWFQCFSFHTDAELSIFVWSTILGLCGNFIFSSSSRRLLCELKRTLFYSFCLTIEPIGENFFCVYPLKP